MKHDDVAIVIAHYNQRDFLRETLRSLLDQTHAPAEIVVVDDGSPTGIFDVEAEFPGVRCVRQANQGAAACRNNGYALTSSPLVCFVDGDDPLYPNALELAVAEFRKNPELGMTVGFSHAVDTRGRVISGQVHPTPQEDDLFAAMLRRHFVCPPGTAVLRREAVDAVGGWLGGDERWGAEDHSIYLRVAAKYPIAVVDEIVSMYRSSSNSMGSNLARVRDGVLYVMDEMQAFTAGNPRLEQARLEGARFYRRSFDERILNNSIRDAWQRRRYPVAAAHAVRYAVKYPRTTLRRITRRG